MADAPSLSELPPPGEPPPGVTSEVLWRLAARLFTDHRPAPAGGDPLCASCQH